MTLLLGAWASRPHHLRTFPESLALLHRSSAVPEIKALDKIPAIVDLRTFRSYFVFFCDHNEPGGNHAHDYN